VGHTANIGPRRHVSDPYEQVPACGKEVVAKLGGQTEIHGYPPVSLNEEMVTKRIESFLKEALRTE
jgi:hypothetical protein